MLGKVLVGLLVVSGLWLIYTLLFPSDARADGITPSTSGSLGTPRPLDKSGQYKAGHDPITGKPYIPGSIFDQLSKGQAPLKVTYDIKTRTW